MNRLLRRAGLTVAIPAGALALAGGAIAFAQQDEGTPAPESSASQDTPVAPDKEYGDGCDHDGDGSADGGETANVV